MAAMLQVLDRGGALDEEVEAEAEEEAEAEAEEQAETEA